MTANGNSNGTPHDSASATGARRRSPWPLVVVAALFIIMPFLTWYATWFGRALTNEEIEKYLADDQKPRHAQHALSQIAERIGRGDTSVERWRPQVVKLSAHPVADVRMTAAWVMGVDHTTEEYRSALVRLLEDPEPIVRRNAALALVRFGDARCRTELLAMLRPYSVKAPAAGTIETILNAGVSAKRDALLARLEPDTGAPSEVRAPVAGRIESTLVKEGNRVTRGQEILVLAPDPAQARDALVGLYYLGGIEDLPVVENYARGVEGMPEGVKQQAAQTLEAVRRRSSQGVK
ncbi:MAG TPA: HEAT repeat domain-containing protein [Pyrinomonadaceae bacterium]|nr:HEAT repeat domain-containing protein [Pyrinomonadaceae bacterium]